MTNFKFITCSDIHISDIAPRSRIDNYKESILNKINQIGKASNKLGVDGVIIAGDLYNLKNPVKNSHNLNQLLIKEFSQFECPIYMIEGNHDLTANNIDSLDEQPLGVLFSDGTLKQLRHEIITKEEKKISLIGIPYEENTDIKTLNIPSKNDCICRICVLHIYASPTEGNLFRERVWGYKEISKLDADIFVFGHYHIDQGIEKIGNQYFINIGSISRGSLADENIEHKPQIGFINITVDKKIDINIQAIKLNVAPANEIFNIQKREEEKQEQKEIEKFVETLSLETEEIDKKDFETIINKTKVAKDVKNRVLSFLQEAATKI